MTSIVLGLALVGCGEKIAADDGAADSTMNDSMTSTTGTGTDSVSETWGEEVSAYADPSDSWWTTDDDGPGDVSTDDESTGTGTDTGETDTDTDTDGTSSDSTGSDSTENGENDSNG
jgi:hypothetical protein